jgi:hypothetical protein
MLATLPDEPATMSKQVLEQISAFHEAAFWGTSSTREVAVNSK